MSLVRAIHLEQWADTSTAREKLGELLRRLVHASIPLTSIRKIRFLANESNQLAGWDGLLDCDSAIPWVPDGSSAWELGTGGNAREKIKKDFHTRLSQEIPRGWSRGTTTYVAVTLRKLDNIVSLENELKDNSPWRSVNIYDAHAMEEWIEGYPSVATWLQEQLVGPPASIRTLETAWSSWSEETEPPVTTKLVLAGREEFARTLRSDLSTSGQVINVRADSPDEAAAFVYGAMEGADPELKGHLLARALVITDPDDADQLSEPTSLYVVLRPPATEKAQWVARRGHTVINALGNSSTTRKVDYRLPRPLRLTFAAALSEMTLSSEKAETEARACGGSVAVWRVWNLLHNADSSSGTLDWANPSYSKAIIPAIFMGGWSDRFPGDEEVIRHFTEMSFTEYRDQLHPFTSRDNPLLCKVEDAWVLTAPATAFALCINSVTCGHLEKLAEIVANVFGEIDPSIDLHPDERPYAALKDKKLRHSHWLRDGLAETLLRIVVIGNRLEESGAIPGNGTCQSFVDQLIRRLPGLSEDWRLIASLRNELPVLAEAAPAPFLEALECLLQGEPEKIRPIFHEGEGLFGLGHAFHTHMLWALETLAWDPKYLRRVGLILARLARIDPGGTLGNRPLNSLTEMLMAWHPSTSASLQQRLKLLDLILKLDEGMGWNLLKTLLPTPHSVSSTTREPLWRDFGRSTREPITQRAIWEAYHEYVRRTLNLAGTNPSRWKDLISIHTYLTDSERELLENGLRELAKEALEADARKEVWEELRNLLNRSKRFSDTSWAISKENFDRLEALTELFEPMDSVDRITWLFDSHMPEIPTPETDLEAAKQELSGKRFQAIEGLLRKQGIGSLMTLLDQVAYPHLVCRPIMDSAQDEREVLITFESANQGSAKQRYFAKYLSLQAYEKFGDRWTAIVLARASEQAWPAEATVNAFELYPDSLQTFELLRSLGPAVEIQYWNVRPGWVSTEDEAVLTFAVEKLMLAKRSLDLVALPPKQLTQLGTKKVVEIIDQCLAEINKGKASQVTGDVGYWIDQLFNWLRGRNDIDKVALARREYAYLPLLTRNYGKEDLTLHNLLATDPNFFVEVLCDLYKRSTEERQEAYSEEQRHRAQLAWQLLHSWHRPPGIDENGQVDGEALRSWVEKSRHLASREDRAKIADQQIGNILFYFPPDPDDSAWPHVKLRELLEELESEHIEKGIEIEQFNSRGVVTKRPFEGGNQERELAKKWRGWADTISPRWPRTGALLEHIADSWEENARREDQEAEKDRLRYG